MQLLISNKNGTPIYDQIYTQIRDQIIRGDLAEEELLPSIRNLAKDLRISVITTKRAYEELERDGFIYSVPGKGFYISPKNEEMIREQHLREIEEYIGRIGKLAAPVGLTKEQVMEMIDTLWEEEQ